MSASVFICFLIVCNGLRLFMSGCMQPVDAELVEDPVKQAEMQLNSFISGIELQLMGMRTQTALFPLSWLGVVFSFLLALAYLEPD